LNNLRVLRYLTETLGASEQAKNTWYRHWVAQGLQVVEALLASDSATGRFCHGDTPGLADCCLVPQVFNAQRFECDLSQFPKLTQVYANCIALEAFKRAAPGVQPDAE